MRAFMIFPYSRFFFGYLCSTSFFAGRCSIQAAGLGRTSDFSARKFFRKKFSSTPMKEATMFRTHRPEIKKTMNSFA
jgi:hypothetical protein